jgi:protein dithiol oxidoreductase (disulfide-forming)
MRLINAVTLIFFGVCCLSTFSANALPYKEGKHFQQVPFEILENELIEDLKAEYPDKIVVLEFFSYGCHWCNQLDPQVQEWKKNKPDYVEFKQFPVVFQNSWVNLSKAYFTAQNLGVLDQVHPALFNAIHDDKLKSSSPDTLQSFFSDYKVDKAKFAKTFDSFGVEQQFKRANQISIAFRITAIPTFIVYGPNGAQMTSTRMSGGDDQLFKVIDTLVAQEYKALATTKDSQ